MQTHENLNVSQKENLRENVQGAPTMMFDQRNMKRKPQTATRQKRIVTQQFAPIRTNSNSKAILNGRESNSFN